MQHPANTLLADGTPRCRTYRYRLSPTARQLALLVQLLWLQCELYNAALEARRGTWRWNRQSVSYFTQTKTLTELRAVRPDTLAFGVTVCRGTLKRLDRAFQNFFDRCRKGETPGYPRFKSAARWDSVQYEDRNGWKIDAANQRLRLYGIGHIKIKLHRQLQGIPRAITVSREGRHWYVSIRCSHVPAKPLPKTGSEVGIDLGVCNTIATSDGELFAGAHFGRQAAGRLARAQRDLATKTRGSNRRKRTVARVATHHRKVANQRKDLAHQISRYLVNHYDTIVFEDLKLKNMVRRPQPLQADDGTYLPNGAAAKTGLNRSLHDASLARVVSCTAYKAEEAGRSQHLVDPRYSSQTCSSCGQVDAKSRISQAVFRCTVCGYEAHADINAARNMLSRAGRAQQAFACAGSN